jgi:hypothetical protein
MFESLNSVVGLYLTIADLKIHSFLTFKVLVHAQLTMAIEWFKSEGKKHVTQELLLEGIN